MPPRKSVGGTLKNGKKGKAQLDQDKRPIVPRITKSLVGVLNPLISSFEFEEQTVEGLKVSSARRESVALAESWGHMLLDKEAQKDPGTSERFYACMKNRIYRKFGTIASAFVEMDTNRNGNVCFVEFEAMLMQMDLPLKGRACRWIFLQASGGEREISLEALKVILLQPKLKQMKDGLRAQKKKDDRIGKHCQTFLSCLTEANDSIKKREVARFQRKMKLSFCQDVYNRIASVPSVREQILNTYIQDVIIERAELNERISRWVGTSSDGGFLLESQARLLMNIFARVGNYRGTTVSVVGLISAMIILSADVDRYGKLKLMFDIFDTDEDTVLDDEQLREWFCQLCRTRPLFLGGVCAHEVAGSSFVRKEGSTVFQEELSDQEGLRNYESVRWRLQRQQQQGAISWEELWSAIRDQENVMSSLIPAPPLMRWAVDPIAVQIEDSLPRATTPLRTQRQVAELLLTHPRLHHAGDGADRPASQQNKRPEKGPKRTSLSCPAETGARPSSRENRRPTSRDFTQSPRRPSSRELAGTRSTPNLPLQGDYWHDSSRPQTTEYRRDLTTMFQQRLRKLGRQRVFELKEGFENPASLNQMTAPQTSHTRSDVSDLENGSPLGMGRPSTTGQSSSLGARRNSLPRLGAKKGLPRSSVTSVRGITSSLGRTAVVEHNLMSAQEKRRTNTLPKVEGFGNQFECRWGVEAAVRNRLLVAAQGSTQELSVGTFGFKCMTCEGMHEIEPKQGECGCEEVS